MLTEEKDKVTIAVYKGFKRYRVFHINPNTLKFLIVVNSLFVIGFVIFFLSFLSVWSSNWKTTEENKLLQKELQLLKK